MPIRGVLLDVGGVLLIPDGAVVGSWLAAAGFEFEPAFDEAHFAGVTRVDEIRGDGDDTGRYLRGYVRRLGIRDDDRAVEALLPLWERRSIELWRTVLPGSVGGLRLLADHGLRLGIVSNSDGTVEEQLLAHGICQLGDGAGVNVLVIVDSAITGVAKPNPLIFASALGALALEPDEIAYVGDSVRYDVVAAVQAGFVAVHFDPHGLCSTHDHHDVSRVADVLELPL